MREKHHRLRVGVGSSLLAVLLLGALVAAAAAVVFDEQPTHQASLYEYRCFRDKAVVTAGGRTNLRQSAVGLQVTDRVSHQLLTRIFAIFLREVLNFRNIWLIPLAYNGSLAATNYEGQRLKDTLESINYIYGYPDMAMINVEVWMPPTSHDIIPTTIYEAGSSISPGRFGWFVPEALVADETDDEKLDSMHYAVFKDPENEHYAKYLMDDQILNYLRQGTNLAEFQSPLCSQRRCVTLLAEFRNDSAFVEAQIEETNSSLNILWLGERFEETITWLHRLYATNATYSKRRFIVLHWTPSSFISLNQYRQISMPKCEELNSLVASNCKYELTPVLKYFSKSLFAEDNDRVLKALRQFRLYDEHFEALQRQLVRARDGARNSLSEALYDDVACSWLKRHEHIYTRWITKQPPVTLSIGGIFPISETSRGHQNLVQAVRHAEDVINANATILAEYDLNVPQNDGQCKADVVMKAFIHYFNMPNVLGVLGPACSETVEPIAGISKHTNMAVISYSAEGASFVDRQTYPYFFRTIGSNRQYEDVYISLMQRFGWHRVAALTEDGQKYTEYISHMETSMKQLNLELIINKKFLSDVTAAEMNKYLVDLKQRHAKIIIADIYSSNSELVLCEAYKLGMTAYEGYVWFLPEWLSKDWARPNSSSNDSCTSEELQMVTEGHFSIMHRPFGELNATMQENITIGQWLENYNGSISNYIGFAYDAVWAYALAADKLLRENKDAVNNLRSNDVVKRFVDLIWETDFEGLSGRVRFGQGGSRITDLVVKQWRNGAFHEVGQFRPHVVGSGPTMRTHSGRLSLREEAIVWLSAEQPPGDGTYDCSFAALAELLATDCDSAAVIFTALLCLMAVVVVSLVSFLFWKQRYDRKIKQSAKIMKTFGIDLLSPSRSKFNTLDKWEVPKENVVVNRRLGEGAFGTVYGGEAQLNADGWTAVAVKTLKAGASTEDRLDFLSEAEAMKRFDHKNIVKLLGVCLQSEPIYTIMEFMLYGDLKTYLLARRHMVNDKVGDESDISPKRLTMYAMDVARGLAYLAEQKYVHRDLACRNCLVNAQRVVKLGDFGMARPIFESDYYRFNRKGMLPVRWMAPESLALGMFTAASDVWAFGVVLYEIITFGSFPYQGLTNNQVLEYVKSGKTLQIPAGVKPHLEGLLKACWSEEVAKRPTAVDIIEYISNYPRLLTPCLDFPGASVEMPETESDELELLPKVRLKRDSTLDILAQTMPLQQQHQQQNNNMLNTNNNNNNNNNINFDNLPRHTFIEELEMEMPSSIRLDRPTTMTMPTTTTESINVPLSAINISVGDTFSPTTPDGYSVMSPLLSHQTSESSDSSHKSPSELDP